jgi:predicted MFS family arabinose efflux permease
MGAFDVGVGLSAIGLGIVLQYTDYTILYLSAAGIVLFSGGACMAVAFQQRHNAKK